MSGTRGPERPPSTQQLDKGKLVEKARPSQQRPLPPPPYSPSSHLERLSLDESFDSEGGQEEGGEGAEEMPRDRRPVARPLPYTSDAPGTAAAGAKDQEKGEQEEQEQLQLQDRQGERGEGTGEGPAAAGPQRHREYQNRFYDGMEPMPWVPPQHRRKTKLCTRMTAAGGCKYGDACFFAHGESDLRTGSRYQVAREGSRSWRSEEDEQPMMTTEYDQFGNAIRFYAAMPVGFGGPFASGYPQQRALKESKQRFTQRTSFDCPQMLVGRIIGRGGEIVKALQANFGCKIVIDQAVEPGWNSPRKVSISGTTSESIGECLRAVQDLVRYGGTGTAQEAQWQGYWQLSNAAASDNGVGPMHAPHAAAGYMPGGALWYTGYPMPYAPNCTGAAVPPYAPSGAAIPPVVFPPGAELYGYPQAAPVGPHGFPLQPPIQPIQPIQPMVGAMYEPPAVHFNVPEMQIPAMTSPQAPGTSPQAPGTSPQAPGTSPQAPGTSPQAPHAQSPGPPPRDHRQQDDRGAGAPAPPASPPVTAGHGKDGTASPGPPPYDPRSKASQRGGRNLHPPGPGDQKPTAQPEQEETPVPQPVPQPVNCADWVRIEGDDNEPSYMYNARTGECRWEHAQ